MFLQKLGDQTGAALALVGLAMVALLSAVALAVDVGMLLTARTEAQTLADGAALEGARTLRDSQGKVETARQRAMLAGSTDNTVRGKHVPIGPEDVDVIPDDWTVRVRVHTTQPTYFARVFGVDEVVVTASAAAWAAPSSGPAGGANAACPLPLALLDEWTDLDGDNQWDPGEEVTGWDDADHGKLIKLKNHGATTARAIAAVSSRACRRSASPVPARASA